MTNPIEELKERLERTKVSSNPVDYLEIAEDFKRLAEAYRWVAAHTGHVCHSHHCMPTCESLPHVDFEASELFQGRTK